MLRWWWAGLALAAWVCACGGGGQGAAGSQGAASQPTIDNGRASWGDQVPLIPRQALFSNPSRIAPDLSPDGTQLAYLAPEEGVLNIWVRTVGASDDRAVTHDRGRGIRLFAWAENGEQLLYLQDQNGDENWRLYAVAVAGGEALELTPIAGVQAEMQGLEPSHPDEVLVGLNDRDPQVHDIYRINVRTGARELVVQNDLGAAGFTADHDLVVRAADVATPDGGMQILQRNGPDDAWRELLAVSGDDALGTQPIGFAGDNRTLYFISSVGSNAAELRSVDLETGEWTTLASDPQYDVSGLMAHPTTHQMEAVAFARERVEWQALVPDMAPDLEALRQLNAGDFEVVDRDRADRTWLVSYTQDTGPTVYYTYDRPSHTGEYLFSARPELDGATLAAMQPVTIAARDGLTLHGYLTTPPALEPHGLPSILLVHGGPWYRDSWGFNGLVQWLANRGYAVLQVNFRGSTGYGKDFTNAGDRQWGLAMQDDLTDSVQWLVDQGVADPQRVCIMGGSYGGYATLAGLAFTPDVYACGVDIVGPSNLATLLASIPPYWEPIRALFDRRVGNPETDAALLAAASPLTRADQIRVPLLIGQGANDPRVSQAESDQIVAALQGHGIPVTYVLYADEGHGFVRPESNLSFFAITEAFLAQHLGGRFEPLGDDLGGANLSVPAGAEQVPGLVEAIGGP